MFRRSKATTTTTATSLSLRAGKATAPTDNNYDTANAYGIDIPDSAGTVALGFRQDTVKPTRSADDFRNNR